MKNYKLYYLTSKLDENKPRYIGYTSLTLEERLSHHLNEAKYNKTKTHKVNWLKKLLKENINPQIKLIQGDIYDINLILDLERNYVERYDNLTNGTNGGEISKSFTEKVKLKISNTLKERYNNGEIEPWNKGRKLTPEEYIKNFGNRKQPDTSGENNSFYGKKHSNKTKKIIGDKNRQHKIYSYEEMYHLYIEENISQKDISKKLNLTRPYVSGLMKKYNLVETKRKKYGKIKGNYEKTKNKD